MIKLKELLKEDFNTLDLDVVKQKAKQLHISIKLTSNSMGKFAVLYDDNSDLSTRGSVFNGKDPKVIDFIQRMKKLREFVNGKNVMYQGNKVIGFK